MGYKSYRVIDYSHRLLQGAYLYIYILIYKCTFLYLYRYTYVHSSLRDRHMFTSLSI
jgi:hypothetical protein